MVLKKWLQIAFFNLLLVSAIGVVLRYKIAFSLPFIDQKKLLHGHSHFAFSGWVTQALMAILISRVSAYRGIDLYRRYRWLLIANLVCAYGMLVSFPIQGYGFISILFSTLAIFVSYVFAVFLWIDINKCQVKKPAFAWFKAAVFFNGLSSLGAFALAFMMATKTVHQNWYLASVYFFLHFQYNGWFSFVILGLVSESLLAVKVLSRDLKYIYRLFVFACGPAYFLSALWMPMPNYVYWVVVAAAVLQIVGWVWMAAMVKKKWGLLKRHWGGMGSMVILLSIIAFSVKVLLQLGSTIPKLGTLAFGFRPIIIGYLHLVLLGFTSLFILGYAFSQDVLNATAKNRRGTVLFITGIICNELVLLVQGVAAMYYISIPYTNELLLALACAIFGGLLVLNWRKISGAKQSAIYFI